MDKDQFSRKMMEILNHGALNLAMGIGYKTGPFDVMADMPEPASIEEIADMAELNARYVKEWMGVMAAGRIVEVVRIENGRNKYFLPEGHAQFLSTWSGDSNFGVYTQEIPLLTRCYSGAPWNRLKMVFILARVLIFSFIRNSSPLCRNCQMPNMKKCLWKNLCHVLIMETLWSG